MIKSLQTIVYSVLTVITLVIYVRIVRFNSLKLPTVIVLNKNRFESDVHSISKSNSINLVSLSSRGLNILNFLLDRQGLIRRNKEGNFASLPSVSGCAKALRFLSKFAKLRFLTCSFYYGQDEFLESACRYVEDVGFFCLYKEYIKDEAVYSATVSRFKRQKFRFVGDGILCANGCVQNILVEAGVCSMSQTSVVGSPRFDLIEDYRANVTKSPRKKVVLFSFHHASGLIELDRGEFFSKADQGSFKNLFDNVHRVFIETSVDFPDLDFIIKTKWDGPWFDEISKIVRTVSGSETSTNLLVTCAGNAQEYIADSIEVIAFNSTTVIEALAVGKSPLIPMFSQDVHGLYERHIYFKRYLDRLRVAHDLESFKFALKESCSQGCPQDYSRNVKGVFIDMADEFLGGYIKNKTSRDAVVRELS